MRSLLGSIVADSGATYTPGVSEKRGTTSTFYHADIKNSVDQTSTSQTVVASKQYDAFGNEVSSSGAWQGPFQYGGAFGYHTDTDYGLKHLGARYYDPTTGRFLSRDPIQDGRNWYAYCNGSPIGYADPTGLDPAPVYDDGGMLLVVLGERGRHKSLVPLTLYESLIVGESVGELRARHGFSYALVLDDPSLDEVRHHLRFARGVYFYGHGDENFLDLPGPGGITVGELESAVFDTPGHAGFAAVWFDTCRFCSEADLPRLRAISDAVYGYEGKMYPALVILGLQSPRVWVKQEDPPPLRTWREPQPYPGYQRPPLLP
jgi:RHS repeat-associated protein